MKSILFISIFIILCTSFAQKDTLKAEAPEPLKVAHIDSVSVKIQSINDRYRSILEKDELIDKKIAEIIKKGIENDAKNEKENKRLANKIESKKVQIDSLTNVIQKYEESVVLLDSVCVRWSFLSKHLDENCKEWKIVILK